MASAAIRFPASEIKGIGHERRQPSDDVVRIAGGLAVMAAQLADVATVEDRDVVLRDIGARRRALLQHADTFPADAVRVLGELRELELLASRVESLRMLPRAQGESREDPLHMVVEIAHDIRSPLGSILFLVERVRSGGSGPLSPLQERQLGLVHSAAFGLSAMASDLMELGQGGRRLFASEPVAFSISALLHSVRDIVQPIAEEKGLTLRLSSEGADLRRGQSAAIARVLLNLVTNAIKFTSNGSVTVTVQARDDGSTLFRVDDTGRGLPEAVTALLNAEQHESPGTHHPFSSAGLGIAICQRLVVQMRGTISATARTPVGTRIDVELPLSD